MKNFREKLYTRQGSRFVPVHENRYFDVLTEGAWLVIVGTGNTAIRRVLNPAYAELEAAMRTAEDAMCTAMLEASKLRPREHEMSKKEQRAWAAYKEIMGDDIPRYLGEYASVQEIVQAGLDAIRGCIVSEDEMKPRKPEASLPDCNVEAADALMGIFGYERQETYYALCDALMEMNLAESRDEAKRMCIEGEISVNGTQERDPWRGVCRFDEVAKRDHKGG